MVLFNISIQIIHGIVQDVNVGIKCLPLGALQQIYLILKEKESFKTLFFGFRLSVCLSHRKRIDNEDQ